MERQPAPVVDELVPHAQAALLRLAEVVRVEDPRHALLDVDHDQAVVGVALGLQVRRVDDGQLGLVLLRFIALEVELLLHPGDVRVRGLDEEPRRRPELRIVADETVDLDHLLARDVGVLRLRPALRLVARDRLVLPVGLVRDEERRALRARGDLGRHVEVPVRRRARIGHLGCELLDFLGARVVDHPRGLGRAEQHLRQRSLLRRGRRCYPARNDSIRTSGRRSGSYSVLV